MRSVGFAAAVALAVVPVAGEAHHSGAMFDQKKTVELSGTVREFQWTNPHSFIQLVVTKDGQATEWSVEMGSPSALFRKGWRPKSVKVGDKVKLVIHPTRDGKPGGTLISASDATGKQIGTGA